MRISDWSSDVYSSDLSERRIDERPPFSALPSPRRRTARPAAAPRNPKEGPRRRARSEDRKSVVEGKSVSVRVDLGGRRIIQKKISDISSLMNTIPYTR